MKTGKKIAVGLAAALVVAIIAAGAVSMAGATTWDYRVVVLEGPNVGVELGLGGVNFGDLSRGETTTLSDSLVLTNTGEAAAKVEAKFTTQLEEEYGLVKDDEEVLPASDFKLGTTENEVALEDTGADKDLGEPNYVPAQDARNYNAVIYIPADQAAGIYWGTIEVIISAV